MSASERRRAGPLPVIAVIAGFAGYALLRRYALPGSLHVVANLVAIGALALVARATSMSREEIGLVEWRAGARLGGAVAIAIAVVEIVAAALPATRSYFETDDADVSVVAMILRVLVVIPLATVVLEELAFRGVLLGLLRRHLDVTWAVVASAVLFGLWHVPPLLGRDGAAEIAAIVAVTTVAGLGFGWLRVRSGSLLAPALVHVATNSVSFALAWAVVRST